MRVATTPLLALVLAVVGCGGSSDPRGERVSVRGAVTLDDVLLDRARIVFQPVGEEKVRATASIVDGFYEIDADRGPLVGPCRVRIESEQLDLGEYERARAKNPRGPVDPHVVDIPAKYNTRTELEAVVTSDPETNKFDFQLRSK